MRTIYLIGMMGSGKTVVAQLLAQQLGRPMVDLDALIEAREKKKITAIFAEKGEAYFRAVEAAVLKEISLQKGIIVATGGGIVLNPQNIECMDATGITIYLKAPTDLLYERLKDATDRPLLQGKDPQGALERIYTTRASLYEKAHLTVNTQNKNPYDVAQEIIHMIEENKLV